MKKIWIFLLLVLPLLFCSGCSMFGYHKIDYPKKSDLITDCPSYAREGKTVHFSTVIVCDAVLNVDLVENDGAVFGHAKAVIGPQALDSG